jgi:protein required for attachment to host cells
MTRHWIVVGDGGEARIFAGDELLKDLRLVDKLHHVQGIITHGETPPVADGDEWTHEAQREAEERFARAVAKVVGDGDNHHSFDRLILIAPPKFLGHLRGALSRPTERKVVASIHHDWVKMNLHDLSAAIRKNIPEAAGM